MPNYLPNLLLPILVGFDVKSDNLIVVEGQEPVDVRGHPYIT